MEALLQIGVDAVRTAKDGVKEGVAQMKESVSPFVEMDQVGKELHYIFTLVSFAFAL